MFFACLLLLLATLSGTLLTWLFDREAPLPARLAMGVCVGLALLAGAGYLLALAFGLGAACIGLSVAVLLAPGLLLVQYSFENEGFKTNSLDAQRLGYLWLFAVQGLLMIRLLIDSAMVRRP